MRLLLALVVLAVVLVFFHDAFGQSAGSYGLNGSSGPFPNSQPRGNHGNQP